MRRVSGGPSAVRSRRVAGAVVAVLLSGALAVAGTVGPAACSSTTSINASLVSGIFIPASLLLGNLGCSDNNDLDVYKYIAVAINDRGDVAGAGIFDCYSEAVFANLPGTDAGSLDFALWVYAYNPSAYAAANVDNKLALAVTTLNGVNQPDGSVVAFSASTIPEAGLSRDAGLYPSALSEICRAPATWVTTCSATSQASVQSLADCRPLALETKVPKDCNLPVLLPDAGPDAFPPG